MRGIPRALLGALLIVALLSGAALAAPRPDLGAFTITSYDVRMDVSASHVCDITETITVRFTAPRHGIERYIPFQGQLHRDVPGAPEYSEYLALVSDVSVQGYKYETSTEDGYVIVRIGDEDVYVNGDQTYVIHYRMAWQDDGIDAFDEFYQNLIGDEWNTTIDRASFTVTMPAPFDAAQLAAFTGSGPIDCQVQGNTITGSTGALRPNEGVTMRLQLPQGYFSGMLNPRAYDGTWAIAILALAALGAALVWLYGRDQRPVITVEFYPPEGMNSAELGYVFDGRADTRDIVSLLMYWAHKGVLRIEQEGDEFTLVRLKDLPNDASRMEWHMFGELFRGRDTVTTAELKYKFYKTVESSRAMLNNSFQTEGARIFTRTSSALKPLLSLFAAVPVTVTIAMAIWRGSFNIPLALAVGGMAALAVLLPVFGVIWTMRNWRTDGRTARVIKLTAFLVFSLITLGLYALLTAMALEAQLVLSALTSTVVLALCAVFIVQRTPQGVAWLGRALGLRDFIERAEREKLERLVEQDPSYFYSVLPYAYVLGITDKWARNFEGIALQPPDWYRGGYGDVFTPLIFAHTLNRSMNSFQTDMTARPQQNNSGSGGFGGGGGFSGGGGGGGGGGSW